MAIQFRRGTDLEWEAAKSNIVAGEPAVALDTKRVFVGTAQGEYTELANKDSVDPIADRMGLRVITDYTIGERAKVVDGVVTTESSSAYKYAKIPCSEGDKFTMSIDYAIVSNFFFADINNNAIPVQVSGTDNVVLTAPANSAFVYINNKVENSYTDYYGDWGETVAERLDNPEITDGSVTTPKIADGAVTTPKLADNSVTTAKLSGVIDSTLAVSGKAADSKATGDAIADLNNDLSAVINLNPIPFVGNFVQGKTLGSYGNVENNSKRIGTVEFTNISAHETLTYTITSGYRIILAFYSSANESSFVSAKYWLTGTATIPVEGDYFRVSYASLNDSTALTLSDVDKVSISFDYDLKDRFDLLSASLEYVPKSIENNLVSDGLNTLPNTQIIKNGSASDNYYGQDNVKYKITLPEHDLLHVFFEYQFTKNVPYVSSGYIDLFQYGGVLYGSERQLHSGQFGIMPQRVTSVHGRGTAVVSQTLDAKYKQHMGNPAFWVKYTGEVSGSTEAFFVVGSNTITINVNGTPIGEVSYSNNDSIQSLVTSLNAITNIECGEIDTVGTCSDLLLIDGTSYVLISSHVAIKMLVMFGLDRTWHTIEAVIDNDDKAYSMAFDGLTVSGTFNTRQNLDVVIGGDFNGNTTPIRLRNLKIDINTYGDAEIVNAPVSANATENTKQLISKHNPRVLLLEGHGVVVGSEEYAQSFTDEMAVSTDRLNAVFENAIAHGYVPVSWQDIIAWKLGLKNLPKRCFNIMMDDYRVENYVDYDKRRPFVKYGVKCGLAMISDLYSLTDTLTINDETYTVEQIIKMIELAGWYPCSHTRNHRDNSSYNPNQLEDEFKADVLSCNKHDMYSDILVYPYGITSYDVLSTMLLSDFAIGVDIDNGGDVYNCKCINDYKMLRTEIGTRALLENVLAPFV